jgi:4-amino-4-deoxy-L-arabinose transferase-like glycosyltransferase
LLNPPRAPLLWLSALLLAIWCVGMFGRGFWTPDEPREADIAWRMSWQTDKAVPLLAGEAFCEKPPLTYWIAALPIRIFGPHAWAARLPNLLYAIIGALSVALLAARSLGSRRAGIIAAALFSTFLLSYQVEIWFATDAPMLGCVAAALFGAYVGFYAGNAHERLGGYSLMHAALGLGFLSKSAAAWMVPGLALFTLIVWEKRWRELLRWELYAGLAIQAALILTWVGFVYAGAEGAAHLKVFFWNNLVGRFTRVDAPAALQYAAAHRNSPGKYFIELPMYLFPWTLGALAAARRAWLHRGTPSDDYRAVRFALAASLPALLLLSLAATARNVYLAPALPGVALLMAWWGRDIVHRADRWDVRALRATAVLLLLATVVLGAAAMLIRIDAGAQLASPKAYAALAGLGLFAAAILAARAWNAARRDVTMTLGALLTAYGALLIGPLAAIYGQVDRWQNLESIALQVRGDASGKGLVLLAPDETTRAIVDMYASTSVLVVTGRLDRELLDRASRVAGGAARLILAQEPGRTAPRLAWLTRYVTRPDPPPVWSGYPGLRTLEEYALPNGRRYALLQATNSTAPIGHGQAP